MTESIELNWIDFGCLILALLFISFGVCRALGWLPKWFRRDTSALAPVLLGLALFMQIPGDLRDAAGETFFEDRGRLDGARRP